MNKYGKATIDKIIQNSNWSLQFEVVKRSGRDESIWVVTHLCMGAMLGISLYSYP
jgi:hypothetical protein